VRDSGLYPSGSDLPDVDYAAIAATVQAARSAPAGSGEAVAEAVQLLEQHQKWMNKLPVPTTGALHQMMHVVGKAQKLLAEVAQQPAPDGEAVVDDELSHSIMKFILELATAFHNPRHEDDSTLGCIGRKAARILSMTPERFHPLAMPLYTRPAPDAQLVEALEAAAKWIDELVEGHNRKHAWPSDFIDVAEQIRADLTEYRAALAAAGKE